MYFLKAVQEFGAMCQERESEIVRGVLPYWPRIYCRISLVRCVVTDYLALYVSLVSFCVRKW